jgi:Uma2 family endonuclease
VLDSQLAHVAVSGRRNARRVWKRQRWPVLHEQLHDATDAYLFFIVEILEPAGEFVGARNLPCHPDNMP